MSEPGHPSPFNSLGAASDSGPMTDMVEEARDGGSAPGTVIHMRTTAAGASRLLRLRYDQGNAVFWKSVRSTLFSIGGMV
jgi:hypothetical protein